MAGAAASPSAWRCVEAEVEGVRGKSATAEVDASTPSGKRC